MTQFPESRRDLLDARFASLARKVGEKYDTDLSVHDQPGETRVVVTIEPVNVYAVDMTGG